MKDKNKLALFSLMVANLAVFYTAVQNDTLMTGNWMGLVRGLGEALPASLGLALVGILNAQLSAEMKARIVFLRWDNPLPGCQAFTRYAATDPRVDLTTIDRDHGPLPTEPRLQNALWYKLYRSVDTEPSVMQVHREFLFTRDYTCLALIMVFLLGTLGFKQIASIGTAFAYFALLLLQFLLAGQAARNHGCRFVTTVLALKSAGR